MCRDDIHRAPWRAPVPPSLTQEFTDQEQGFSQMVGALHRPHARGRPSCGRAPAGRPRRRQLGPRTRVLKFTKAT